MLKNQKKVNLLKKLLHSASQNKPRTLLNLWKRWGGFVVMGILVSVPLVQMQKEIRKIKAKESSFRRSISKMKKEVASIYPLLGGMPIPQQLRNIPFADKTGIVLGVKTVSIRGVLAPYNASLVENKNGYSLFFRYDIPNHRYYPAPFFSYIGAVELNKEFEQTTKEFKCLNLGSDYAEDPRVIKIGQDLYISYNDIQPHNYYCRSIRIAQVNPETFAVNFVTNLDFQMQHVEKNWTPFEYIGEDKKPRLRFEYNISPHTILELPNPKVNNLNHLVFQGHPSPPRLPWQDIWGHPYGGTSPKKVDGQYLSFFHSRFTDKEGIVWYLLGAYTFEAKEPFRITAISSYPILFENMYESPPVNTANPKLRAMYACSFVTENKEGQELIHVSCGENDSAVKVITMDKKALFKSLKPIPNLPRSNLQNP